MIKGHRIRCILFDLGNTLWTRKDKSTLLSIEDTSNLNAVKVLRRFTSDKELSLMESRTLGALLRRSVERQIRFETRHNPGYEPDFVLTTMKALWKLGISQANRTLGEDIYEALRIRIPGSRLLFDDTLSMLTVLKKRGYILSVVTNRPYGGRLFHEDLQTMGLLDYFEYDHMAISADLGIRKPNPAIFMHALNRLCVTPEEAAMVGDSLKADILGAKMLNILAIWKPNALMLQEAKVAWISTYTATRQHKTHIPVEQSTGKVPDDVPPEAFEDENKAGFTDDYLLSYIRNRDGQKLHSKKEDIKPDIIIKNLKDLLGIF
jgi:FMN phosphatase YigB (HAD superfamily)